MIKIVISATTSKTLQTIHSVNVSMHSAFSVPSDAKLAMKLLPQSAKLATKKAIPQDEGDRDPADDHERPAHEEDPVVEEDDGELDRRQRQHVQTVHCEF